MRCRMSRVRIGDTPAADEMLDGVVYIYAVENSSVFTFQMCPESGDGSGTFRNWRQRVADSWCRNTDCNDFRVFTDYTKTSL